jgi:DNA polymerase-1
MRWEYLIKTLLIDAKNTLYRHNYTSNLTDPQGNKVSGVFGMLKDVTNQIKIHKPDNVVIAWDVGKSKGRCAIYPEYKAHRKKDDKELLENLAYQAKMAKLIFKHLPVKQLAVQDIEADDIIGFLCKKLQGDKIIFSNDSDFYQLIGNDVKQFVPKQKTTLDLKKIEEKMGFSMKYYPLWKSIVGDSSDNIVGVKGLGAKTATKIINKEKKKKFTEEQKEIIKRNLKLINIGGVLTREDKMQIAKDYKSESSKRTDTVLLRQMCRRLGFKSILMNFNGVVYVYNELNKKRRE